MHIGMDILLAPGSGSNTAGKFYIGIRDAKCACIVHGANTANGGGTTKKHPSVESVNQVVRTKLRGDYKQIKHVMLNDAAKNTVLNIVCRAYPGFDPMDAQWTDAGITFGASAPKQTRPKKNKTFTHSWI